MKNKSLSISIPEPCHEKWSEMTDVEQGRHCQSCQKTVVDFTRMPKVKIAEFISEQSGSMCGRFSSDQLNVELMTPKPTKSWFKYAAIILGLAPALGYGQEVITPRQPVQEMQLPPITGDIKIETKGEMVSHLNLSTQEINIKGKIIDGETKKVLPTAVIKLCKINMVNEFINVDNSGKFNINVPKDALLGISCEGYESKVIKYADLKTNEDLKIALREIPGLMGIIMIEEPSKKRIEPEKIKIGEFQKVSHKINKSVEGKLMCRQSGEEILFGTVAVYINDILQYGVETDFEGKFKIEFPERARIEASQIGYDTQIIDYQDVPNNSDFIISLEPILLKDSEFVNGYFISETNLDQGKNKKYSRPIEHVEHIKRVDNSDGLILNEEFITYDKSVALEKAETSSDIPLKYLSPAVEIVALRHPFKKGKLIGSYAIVKEEKKDNWLKRQWKKFKTLIHVSHEDAVITKLLSKHIHQAELNYNVKDIGSNTISNIDSKNQILSLEKDKLERINIKIYPNPTSGQIEINVPKHLKTYKIQITNMNNELILTKEGDNKSNFIDLSLLLSGSYVLSVISSGELVYSEILVKT